MSKAKILAAALTAVTALTGATSAFAAGENHFEGAYVVVTQEWKKASVTVDGEKIKKSEAAPSIGLGYTFALDKYSTVGLKATFDTKSGEYGVGEVGGTETEVKEKSHYSLAVEPGFAINDKVLVFGILAYHKAKAELVGAETGTAKVSGYGYGLGAKYSLDHHLFLMAELQNVSYSSQRIAGADVKPASKVFALGLGYHF